MTETPAAQGPGCSIVVPVLHEAATIAALVAHLRALPTPGPLQIIVVDGAPEAETLAALHTLQGPDLTPLASTPGRATQMNLGARAARHEALLFLHADTTLPERALHLVAETLAEPGLAGDAFDLDFGPAATPGQRFIARAACLRSRLTRAPYGDQAPFLRRSLFLKLGGFPEIPLMEDLALMTRLRRQGLTIRIHAERAVTSPRRWNAEGTARCTARNLLIRTLYHLGAPPSLLARLYRFAKQNPKEHTHA